MSEIVADDLGYRYGGRWALRGCSITIPSGAVVALVGPNGAGKSTLLHLLAGLLQPQEGTILVDDLRPGGSVDAIAKVGLVAQDVPLYLRLSIAETGELGRRLNRTWDGDTFRGRIDALGVSPDHRVGDLSGGQRAQLALALALAKRPDVLLLDEPLASLDPLARREFLRTLMGDRAERPVTVVLSSHLVVDLERICDHVVVLSRSRVALEGDIEELLSRHRFVTGPPRPAASIPGVAEVLSEERTDRQTTALVRLERSIFDPAWSSDLVSLEEMLLAHLGLGPAGSGQELPPARETSA